MRLLFLGNNRAAWRALQWLRSVGTDIAGVVVHPANRRTFGDEILDTAGVSSESVFHAERLGDPDTLARIDKLRADVALSVSFGYILRAPFLRMFPGRCLNLHPAYLPFNRGAYPNVWSIVDRTPAGVTLHHVDEGIDTGDVVAQRKVPILPTDTGATLYDRLEDESLALLRDTWPRIVQGDFTAAAQPTTGGTVHRTGDAEKIDRIDLDRLYTGRELIDVLRARTFPPHRGAYFEDGGKRIYLRLELIPQESIDGSHD